MVANLLRSEMEPLLGAIAARMRPGGHAVLSGLLDTDRDAVLSAFGGFQSMRDDLQSKLFAFMLPDAALTVSGLLDKTVGGPSVYPPQPASVTALSA